MTKFIFDCNVFLIARPFCRLLVDKQMTMLVLWVRGYRRVTCAEIQFHCLRIPSVIIVFLYDTKNRKRTDIYLKQTLSIHSVGLSFISSSFRTFLPRKS